MQQQPPAAASRQHQLFDALHGELVAEARGVAREMGANVGVVVFRPDDGALPRAVKHVIRGNGVAPEARVRQGIRKLVARDVSAMSAEELAQHAARLQALKAAVVSKLRGKEEEEAADVEGMVKRAPEKQEMLAGAAGCGNTRRMDG